MSVKQRYQRDLQQGFKQDSAQRVAVEHLDALSHALEVTAPMQQPKLRHRLLRRRVVTKVSMPRGLYLWGGVGRGKTYLMDLFYESLTTSAKQRFHFHHFMSRVHQQLKGLSGQSDPLKKVAEQFTREFRVLCFDEFYVSDITDAMLIGTLFDELFQRGLTLVATSNCHPDDLYKNGLQRAKFLPAIALLKEHCEVLNVDGGEDYRLRTLKQAEIYHYPLDSRAEQNLQACYRQLTQQSIDPASSQELEIGQRNIRIRQAGHGVLMADFHALCCTARSQLDYMEIARRFHTVLLSDLQQMNEQLDDAARRFIAMVDEFYERRVKLIISAAVPLGEIYTRGRLEFEFQRTRSRLEEMQSFAYLELPHLA
ncbi:cell division protein ZapE [Dongshaea marina]|uniref:cell division protein ZapE n=1 Tax=Dongshaea marina TaxID=2047966 RepID=UPI000D3EA67B|nr:cell division protein ZapE [Dongshaea marina]